MYELEDILKHANEEYNELMNIFKCLSRENGKSKTTYDKIDELIHLIEVKCLIGQFAEVKEARPSKSVCYKEELRNFKFDTRYGCGLWKSNFLDSLRK